MKNNSDVPSSMTLSEYPKRALTINIDLQFFVLRTLIYLGLTQRIDKEEKPKRAETAAESDKLI